MTSRFLHGHDGRDDRWVGGVARHGRSALALAAQGMVRAIGFAPRKRRGFRAARGKPGHSVGTLNVLPVSAHRHAFGARGIRPARVARHGQQPSARVTRIGGRPVAHHARHAGAYAGLVGHDRGHRRTSPHVVHVEAGRERGHEGPRLARLKLLHGVGQGAFRTLRPGRMATPGRSLAPRARGGSGVLSPDAMRRDASRTAAEALRREDGHLDHALRAHSGIGRGHTGSDPGHVRAGAGQDRKGPMPSDLREEVRHALHEVRTDPRAEMRRLFADESRRPPSGVTGFDHRLAPIWAGRKPGY